MGRIVTMGINKTYCPVCGSTNIEDLGKELHSDDIDYICDSCDYTYTVDGWDSYFDFYELQFITGNEDKVKEYRRLGLEGLKFISKDLPEVASQDAITVALHKAFAAGEYTMIEDTALYIEGAEVGTDIKWMMERLPEYIGRRAKFSVTLAVNVKSVIAIFIGEVEGTITASIPTDEEVFGFDNNFTPDGQQLNLFQLEMTGLKDKYSARKKAVDAMLKGIPFKVVRVTEVGWWEGKMQGEDGTPAEDYVLKLNKGMRAFDFGVDIEPTAGEISDKKFAALQEEIKEAKAVPEWKEVVGVVKVDYTEYLVKRDGHLIPLFYIANNKHSRKEVLDHLEALMVFYHINFERLAHTQVYFPPTEHLPEDIVPFNRGGIEELFGVSRDMVYSEYLGRNDLYYMIDGKVKEMAEKLSESYRSLFENPYKQ